MVCFKIGILRGGKNRSKGTGEGSNKRRNDESMDLRSVSGKEVMTRTSNIHL